MKLSEMYDELENLGDFSTDLEELNQEQIDFLEEENDYDIDLEDLLELIDEYYNDEYAEIRGIYDDVEDLAEEIIDIDYDIPDNLKYYFDYESFGRDLLNDNDYRELQDGRIVNLGL